MEISNNVQKPKGFDSVTQKKDSRVDKSEAENKGIISGSDGIEISEEAQEIRKIIGEARSELHNAPDIREAKVADVTAKLSSGFYDRPEVIERLADKLISIF